MHFSVGLRKQLFSCSLASSIESYKYRHISEEIVRGTNLQLFLRLCAGHFWAKINGVDSLKWTLIDRTLIIAQITSTCKLCGVACNSYTADSCASISRFAVTSFFLAFWHCLIWPQSTKGINVHLLAKKVILQRFFGDDDNSIAIRYFVRDKSGPNRLAISRAC